MAEKKIWQTVISVETITARGAAVLAIQVLVLAPRTPELDVPR